MQHLELTVYPAALGVTLLGLKEVLLALKELLLFGRDRAKERRQVKVTTYLNIVKNVREASGKQNRYGEILPVTKQVLVIKAVNTGHRPVLIERAGLLLSSGKPRANYKSYENELPAMLTDGQRVLVKLDLQSVQEGPGAEAAFVMDSLENIFKGDLPRGLSWE